MFLPTRVSKALLRNYPRVRPLLPRGYHAYRTEAGRIYLDLRESKAMFARAVRQYEVAKVRNLVRFLPAGGTFVDVGGNKGDFALIAARHLRGQGRVVCVEPEPGNVKWIRRSVERNGYPNVQVVEAALAAEEGTATLNLGPLSGWHSLADASADRSVGTITVPTRTLDRLLDDVGAVPDVLKIDVEGGEGGVLAGADRLLGSDRPLTILFDLHPGWADTVGCLSLLESNGFSLRDPVDPDRPVVDAGPSTTEVVAIRR